MNYNARSSIVLGWLVGSISLVLLISAGGLEFFAQQTLGRSSVATLLLSLFLASWFYFLGIIGLVLLSTWRLLRWLRVPVNQAVMMPYSPAKPRRLCLEEPELENPQYFEHNVGSAVPIRLTRQSDDRNKTISSARGA